MTLITESERLENTLKEIVATNYDKSISGNMQLDLSKALSERIIRLGEAETETVEKVFPWQRRRLMCFRDRYQAYWNRCCALSLPGIPTIPSELNVDAITQHLAEQREEIIRIFKLSVSEYDDSASVGPPET
ncbi:MAG: hypothetical protein ACR2JB_27980 [Bryobacteraceae bacterium]